MGRCLCPAMTRGPRADSRRRSARSPTSIHALPAVCRCDHRQDLTIHDCDGRCPGAATHFPLKPDDACFLPFSEEVVEGRLVFHLRRSQCLRDTDIEVPAAAGRQSFTLEKKLSERAGLTTRTPLIQVVDDLARIFGHQLTVPICPAAKVP